MIMNMRREIESGGVGWAQLKLEDVVLQQKGALVSGPFGSSISAKFFVDVGVPVIRGNNLTKGEQKFIDEGFAFLTDSKAAEFSNCIATEDDIIFTAAGSIGQVGIIPEDRRYSYYIISNKQLRARIDPAKAKPLFVYYWLSSRKMVRWLEGMNNGGAVPLLNLGIVRKAPIPCPPLKSQQRICDILSAYDNLIENNQRRIQLLEKAAQLLYKEWFVHLRFPGHEHITVTDGVPEGWERKHLSELVFTQYGFTETATDEPIGPRFLRGMDINKTSYIDWSTVPFCSEDNLDFRKYALQVGDIVVIRMADPGKVAIVETEEKAIFASYLVRFILKMGIDIPSLYLFYTLSHDAYQCFISGASGGSTRKSASAKLLVNFNILIPSKMLMTLFIDQVYPLRQQIQKLLQKNACLMQARDLVLPRLMRGNLFQSIINIGG